MALNVQAIGEKIMIQSTFIGDGHYIRPDGSYGDQSDYDRVIKNLEALYTALADPHTACIWDGYVCRAVELKIKSSTPCTVLGRLAAERSIKALAAREVAAHGHALAVKRLKESFDSKGELYAEMLKLREPAPGDPTCECY